MLSIVVSSFYSFVFWILPYNLGIDSCNCLHRKEKKNCPRRQEQSQECCFSKIKCKLPILGLGGLILCPLIFKCCPIMAFLILGGIAFAFLKKRCRYSQGCGMGNNGCPLFSNSSQFTVFGLHRAALKCLDSNDKAVLQKGKDMLLKILNLVPGDKIALYNLACAESLLGNVTEAIATLEQSIDAGYHDLSHMINDPDFNNIKDTEGFKKLVKKLEKILVPEKQEEPVHIPKVQDPVEQKLDTLEEIYPLLTREALRELLTKCKGNVEEVIETIFKNKN